MDLYLLKFSACLFVFWLVYWLLLEKQDMHRFKRFYLLGSVVIALIIPLLSITTYVEPVAITPEVLPAHILGVPLVIDTPTEVASTVDVWSVLRIVYGIGVFIFLLRFVLNLGQLYRRILNNKTQKVDAFIYVLLKNYRIPHSFFKYIFLNEQRFEDQAIPEEVLLHEQTHARQLHSIDIILLELLQVVFWFHPLVYILKHHIKLNHEFLADEAVLNQGTDAKNYQNVLLQFSSSTQHQQLASAINYSSFKKRFTVMKTQTSNTKKWLSSLLLIPVIAILFYSFAEHKEVVKSTETTVTSDFLVTVEKNDNTLELRCESGCNWSQITLEPRNTPYIINDYGFTDGSSIDSDKFAFSIQPTDIGVALDGLAGTAWIDLKFSLGNNKKQAINQMGMTKYTPRYNNVINPGNLMDIKAINDHLYINGLETDVNNYALALNSLTKDWSSKDFKTTSPNLNISECSQNFLDLLDTEFRKSNYFIITIQGSKSLEDIRNDNLKAYLKKYEVYKKLQDTPPHYIKKSKSDQEKMEKLFSELGGMYFRMPKANKAKVNRPVAPVHPYVKITLKGKTYYKEFKDLTEEEKATLPPPPPPAKSSDIIQKPLLWIMVNKKGELLVGDEVATVSELEEKLRRLSKSNTTNRLISIQYDKETSKKLIKELEILITKYKFKVFSIDAAKIPPPPPPPPPAVKKSKGGPNVNDIQNGVYNPTFLEYVVEMEELGASFYLDEKPITANEAKTIAKNNKGKRTDMLTQKDANGKFVVKLSSPIENTIQKGATKEQLSKYNAWAKKINIAMNKAIENDDFNVYPIIKMKEFEHYKYIFDFVMTEAQRKQAEPFPDKLPPPPPRPKTPKYKETRLKQPKSPAPPKPVKIEVIEVPEKDLTPNEKARLAKKTKEYLEKHPEKIKKQKAKKGGSLEEIEVPLSEIEEVPPPPPPPAPEKPLELLKRMANTNAKFFYEEKAISSEKAIELLKRNSDLNVRAHKTDSKQPLIYISKKPIVVEVKSKSKN